MVGDRGKEIAGCVEGYSRHSTAKVREVGRKGKYGGKPRMNNEEIARKGTAFPLTMRPEAKGMTASLSSLNSEGLPSW